MQFRISFLFLLTIGVICLLCVSPTSGKKLKKIKKELKKMPLIFMHKKKIYLVPCPFPLPIPILKKLQPIIYKEYEKEYVPMPSYPSYPQPSYPAPQPDYSPPQEYGGGYDGGSASHMHPMYASPPPLPYHLSPYPPHPMYPPYK